MTAYAISTPTYISALTLKTGADTYNINGSTLTIDCDSRFAPNATSTTGPLGSVSVSISLGGHLQVTTEFTKLIPYSSGTGLVPTYGTVITQGTANAVLLCVMETKVGGNVYLAGATLPATGWLKVRVTTTGFVTGALTGISATATAVPSQGWIEVVGQELGTHTHVRLGTMQMRGDWIDVGTTTGVVGQTMQLPHFTANGATYYPGVDIETAPSSGVYQFFPNAGVRHTSVNCSTDTRSSFVYINIAGLVSIGMGTDAIAAGYVPVAGCKVRVPSINLQNCSSTARQTNIEPSRTMGTRYESSYINAGLCDVRIVTGAWYWNITQPYSVYIRDLHTCDTILIAECATPANIDNLHQGISTSATEFASTGIVIQQSYTGGTVGTMSWLRSSTATTSGYSAMFVNLYGGWTFAKLRGGALSAAAATAGALYFNTCGATTITELWTFTKRMLVQAADNLKVLRHVYADNCIGTTSTVAQSRAIECVGQCSTITLSNLETWPNVANCHPYLAVVAANTTQKLTLRNCGTAANPYNAGTVNQTAYLFEDMGNCDLIKVQRNWTTALRLGLHGGNNTTKRFVSVNNYQVDASKTIGPQQIDSVVHGNRFNSGAVPSSYSAVYGNSMWDGFTGDTTTRAALIFVEKSAANADSYNFVSGSPKFTGSGSVTLQAINDTIEYVWSWRILGWNGLVSMASTGVNTANHLYEYSLDKGTGYGAYKTMSNANLLAETGIDPVVGIGLKMRISCTTANNTNRLDSLRIDGTTTLALQNVALYPLDNCALVLSGLQTGSSVSVFSGVPTAGQAPIATLLNSSTSATLSYVYDSAIASCTLRVRKVGYAPIDLLFTNNIDVSIPVAQQYVVDGFGVAIYGRGDTSTAGFITLDGPALRVDIGNALCKAEDVHDVMALWQTTATGMKYPEVMRFDGRDMLLMGSWRLRRALAAYSNAGVDAAVVIDGMTTASPDDEVNGSVDIRAKAVRTYSTTGGTLTSADVAAAVWAYTLSTGNPASSELLATKTAASNAFAVSA